MQRKVRAGSRSDRVSVTLALVSDQERVELNVKVVSCAQRTRSLWLPVL